MPPAVVITGGSLGAGPLNTAVPEALARIKTLVADWRIVHQTGERDLPGTRECYRRLGVAVAVLPVGTEGAVVGNDGIAVRSVVDLGQELVAQRRLGHVARGQHHSDGGNGRRCRRVAGPRKLSGTFGRFSDKSSSYFASISASAQGAQIVRISGASGRS